MNGLHFSHYFRLIFLIRRLRLYSILMLIGVVCVRRDGLNLSMVLKDFLGGWVGYMSEKGVGWNKLNDDCSVERYEQTK